MAAEPRRPLEGVKCVAVTMFQQGPVAFAHMADLGADVIKIEPPGRGEDGRRLLFNPNQYPLSPYFETNNRGVRDLTLNFQKEEGLKILYELVKDADIFAQNFRPDVPRRYHFAYEDLVKVNPGIIYLTMSAYGPDGPNADLPGTDAVAQAQGGIASTYGDPNRMYTGQAAISDETGAITNFGAMMVALYHKRMTGEGQKIETSLLGGTVRLMGFSMTRAVMLNDITPPSRSRINPGLSPGITTTFYDKDGKPFTLQVNGEDRWVKGMEAAGFMKGLIECGCGKLGDIANSPELQKAFFSYLDTQFAKGTREEWLKKLRSADVVCAPLYNLIEAGNDPDAIANRYTITVDHPKYGKIREVGYPWKFSKTPARAGIAPELGEHTVPILKNLGYKDAQIEELRNKGVI